MLGFILFLLCLLLVFFIVKLVIDQSGITPQIRTIVYLILLVAVLVWLFGGGGFGSVYGWHFR